MSIYMKILVVIMAAVLFSGGALIFAYVEGDENTTVVTEQESEVPEVDLSESVFVEIHATPEGVYVIDSAGETLELDPESQELKKADEKRKRETTTVTIFRGGRSDKDKIEEIVVPVPELPDADQLAKELEKAEKEIELADLEQRMRGLKIGKVIIEENETVKGPLVSIGEIIVRGKVKGDVISYKRIIVTSTGLITGDASAPEIRIYRGGEVIGALVEYSIPTISVDALIATASILAGLLIFGSLTLFVAPRHVNRVKECLDAKFIKSFLIGLLFWLAFGPLISLLLLTIIGIPVVIIVMPIAILLAIILAAISMGQFVGDKLSRYISFVGQSQKANAFVGLFILFSSWIIMSLFHLKSTPVSSGFATLFLVISIVIWSLGICAGIGAVILTRFGYRDHKREISIKAEAGGAPPPPPTPPPISRDGGL